MEDLITLMSTIFDYPVYRRASRIDTELLPDDFFTFWSWNATGGRYYDNQVNTYNQEYDIYYHTTNPTKVEPVMEALRQLLHANGYTITNYHRDIPADILEYTVVGIYCYIQNPIQNDILQPRSD